MAALDEVKFKLLCSLSGLVVVPGQPVRPVDEHHGGAVEAVLQHNLQSYLI